MEHITTTERHVHADEGHWQVRCEHCGIAADHFETEEVTTFLAGLHHAGVTRYVRAKESTGRTHVLDLDAIETLCGAQSQSNDTDAHPDLASCLPCWSTWELLDGTTMQHAAGLTVNLRPLPPPYRRKDTASMRAPRLAPNS
jgi:hypothetical protein